MRDYHFVKVAPMKHTPGRAICGAKLGIHSRKVYNKAELVTCRRCRKILGQAPQ